VITRLRNLAALRRHPSPRIFSLYLEGELDARAHRRLEAHIHGCPRCRRALAALASTVRALGSLGADSPRGLAESIIAALAAEAPHGVTIRKRSEAGAGAPALKLVPGSAELPAGDRIQNRWPREARSALRWCLQKAQLRLTLPIGVVAGVVLSLANMGGLLMKGRIDAGVCVSCAIDFLVPFLALNLGLLMLMWVPRRRRL
jgi:anti-sigma factor RsiW